MKLWGVWRGKVLKYQANVMDKRATEKLFNLIFPTAPYIPQTRICIVTLYLTNICVRNKSSDSLKYPNRITQHRLLYKEMFHVCLEGYHNYCYVILIKTSFSRFVNNPHERVQSGFAFFPSSHRG